MPRHLLPVVLLAALLAAVAAAAALRGQRVAESGALPGRPLPAPPSPTASGTPAAAPALVAGIQPEVLARYRQGAAADDAMSQDNLASCYEQGLGVPADPAQAAIWYRRSAEHGFAPAQFHLGDCFENGKGLGRDLEQARHWYRLAAGQGMAQAASALKRIGNGSG
jgi:TPR repeat protein